MAPPFAQCVRQTGKPKDTGQWRGSMTQLTALPGRMVVPVLNEGLDPSVSGGIQILWHTSPLNLHY